MVHIRDFQSSSKVVRQLHISNTMFELIFKVKLTWAQVNLMDFTMGAGESRT